MRIIYVIFIVLFSINIPVYADDLQDGVDAFIRGDYSTVFKKLRPLAEQGNPFAQYGLAWAYHNGPESTRNSKEAVKWYKLSAEQGNTSARSNLAIMYRFGKGITKDYKKAVKWYSLGAKQGDIKSQLALGWMYLNGEGVAQDYKEAFKWYSLGAKQGDAISQSNLGMMYDLGKGVTQDYKEAFKWYRLSANQGNAVAQNSLGMMYSNGIGIAPDYKKALMWYRLAAEQGDAFAQSNIGGSYATGKGVAQDYKEAVKWNRLSAEQGNALAQAKLGTAYRYGRGVTEDHIQAHKWYSIAVKNGEELVRKFRDAIEKKMTPVQISEAQRLAEEWMQKYQNIEISKSLDKKKFKQPNTPQVPKKNKSLVDDLSKDAAFYDVAGQVYSDYAQIFNKTKQIHYLTRSYLGGEITREYAEKRNKLISTEIKLKMESVNKNNDELPKPPILNDAKSQKLTQDYYGFIKALPRNIENTFDIYSKLFNASISGNSTLINKYDKLSRQSVIILLEGENFIFKLDNEKRSKDHPRSWLNKAIIHSNESQIAIVKAIIVEIEGYIDGMGMGIDRNIESHTYTEQAKTSLNSAQKAILIGRTKIEPTRNSNRSSLSGTAFDKHIPIFDKISDSYHESFDIEGNILDILQVINDASPSDEDMQEAGILWASLVVKRTNLMSKRNKWFSKTLRQIKH
jgi:uncharacterized protein